MAAKPLAFQLGPALPGTTGCNGRTLSGTSAASSSQTGIGPAERVSKLPASEVQTASGNRIRSMFGYVLSMPLDKRALAL